MPLRQPPDPPPNYPSGLGPNGRVIPGLWQQLGQQYVGKWDSNNRTFVIHDQHLTYPNDTRQILKVGPPSSLPGWPELLEKWGLQVLEAAGFINDTSWRNSRPTDIKGKNYVLHYDGPIHPVLRRNMWDGMSDELWHAMQPALYLATAILDEPDTLNFLDGLMVPSHEMRSTWIPHIGRCAFFRTSDINNAGGNTAKKWADVFQKVVDMCQYVRWSIAPDASIQAGQQHLVGYTQPQVNGRPGARNGTFSSTIRITDGFTNAIQLYLSNGGNAAHRNNLRSNQQRAGIPIADQINIGPNSAILRTHLGLANCMIHELGHAIGYAYWDRTNFHITEPFFEGDRACEIGYVLSRRVLGETPYPMQFAPAALNTAAQIREQEYTYPFGTCMVDRWDKWAMDPGNGDSSSAIQAPRVLDQVDYNNPQRIFPIPQNCIEWLFDPETWREDVNRFGLEGIKFPRLNQWAVDEWRNAPPPATNQTGGQGP